MNFSLSNICTPATIYLVLGILSILGTMFVDFSIISVLMKTVFVLIYTWFLNFLCSRGYSGISWFLVLLPFIFIIVIFIIGFEFLKNSGNKKIMEKYFEKLEKEHY
jgi:hypothetical protein